jgi:hypothetical protein
MHRFDVLGGMLPEVHPYIDLPFMSALVANYVSSHAGFQCDLTPWLLGGSGDHGGSALGQPLAPYAGGDSYVANNLVGAPMWSPGGNEVLLQERMYGPPQGTGSLEPVLGSVPSRLLIAKLDLPPSKAIPVTSSDVGSWAPSAATAGTGFDHPATVTVHGKATGTATITYTGDILSSADSVSYTHFSDDGNSFADGTETIDNPQLLTTPVSLSAHIVITGAHRGSFDASMTAGEGQGQAPSGTIESRRDGMTRSGLPAVGACPRSLPHPVPAIAHPSVTRGARTATITVRVIARIFGAGMNQLGTDSRPIRGAVVQIAGRRLITDAGGVAATVLPEAARPRRYLLRVAADDTFLPARTTITVPSRRRRAR